jgi:hypothetical protein
MGKAQETAGCGMRAVNMELRGKKIILALFVSFVFIFSVLFLYYFFPWDKVPIPMFVPIGVVTAIWIVTIVLVARAKALTLYIGNIYTPEGEVTKGSKNEKIFLAIVAVAVITLIIGIAFLALVYGLVSDLLG